MASGIAQQVGAITERLELSQEDVAEIVGTSSRTINRWSNGTAFPQRQTKQRLLELAAVSEMLAEVMRPEDGHLWLFSPNRLLNFDTPAERISSGRFRDVLGLIEALADGVVV